jgi:hypothetical protein
MPMAEAKQLMRTIWHQQHRPAGQVKQIHVTVIITMPNQTMAIKLAITIAV